MSLLTWLFSPTVLSARCSLGAPCHSPETIPSFYLSLAAFVHAPVSIVEKKRRCSRAATFEKDEYFRQTRGYD